MILAVVQARMGAARLYGKVLKHVCGKELLLIQNERLKKSSRIDRIVIATTDSGKDDPIEDFCVKNGIDCFRGDEDDVLKRYYDCALKYGADIIVRITGDCPLVDPDIIDRTVSLLIGEGADFAANTVPPDTSSYPDGSDVEVFTFKALERAFRECEDKFDRGHVTFYFWKYDNGFRTVQLREDFNYSKYRFTVDYEKDLKVVEYIVRELEREGKFGAFGEVIDILKKNKDIAELNSEYYFGIGWEKDRVDRRP